MPLCVCVCVYFAVYTTRNGNAFTTLDLESSWEFRETKGEEGKPKAFGTPYAWIPTKSIRIYSPGTSRQVEMALRGNHPSR